MVDLSRLMQDAATLEVIEKSAIEAQVLRHDVEAYRACLGYSVSGDHDGRLSDGTLPNNGIAEALDNECRTLSAQNSAQAMQIDELKRDLAAAQEDLWVAMATNDSLSKSLEARIAAEYQRAQRAEDIAQIKAWQLLDSEESKKRAEALAESYRKALLHERTALATVRDRQCHDGVCAISLADIEKGIALLDAAIAGEKP